MKTKFLTIAALAWLIPSTLSAKEFNSADLLEKATKADCIDYCVVGMCHFVTCTPFGCSYDTKPRIRHYLPDLVVTVSDEAKKNPWTEYREVMSNAESAVTEGVLGELAGAKIGGGSIISPNLLANSNTRFKEASVVGHPLAVATRQGFSGGFLCPSNAEPYKPYFSSVFDYLAWRWGLPDNLTVQSWVPGMREIGSMSTSNPIGNSWGAVYPRQGMVVQQDDVIASAVIAQRAVDIVTNTGQPHVYLPFDSNDEFMSGQNGKVKTSGKANERKDRWQQISPKTDSTCQPFGNNNLTWSAGRDDGERRYGWAYWRQYECCTPGAGLYIGSTPAPEFCLK
ncbi:MAG: TIGR03756 family integrating conjugative element protein [Methyloprofundus sp.]|nr:TIGR03756 family integrating conjugative element protein [Methyloprofundus sp.]